MKPRKWICIFVSAACMCTAARALNPREDENTLLVIPRNDERAVQFGLDLAEQYPTLLVTYLFSGSQVSLHGWTGSQWVSVTPEAFQKGDFFHRGPTAALLIEPEGVEIPAVLTPPASWCPYVAKIETTQLRPLIHLAGQFYDFGFKRWQWYSKRYNLPFDAINPEGLNVAWYQKSLLEHLAAPEAPAPSDLKYWIVVREPVAAMPVVPVESTNQLPAATSNDMVSAAAPAEENPLTNAIPPAVVMEAAPAETADKQQVPVASAAKGE